MSNSPSSNREPTKRLPDGSVDWEHALSAHRRWLNAVLLARGVEARVLEEVWQEVAASAIAHVDKLQDIDKLAPWLYRITVTEALQYRRRVGRRKKLVELYATTALNTSTKEEPDPLSWLLAEEQRQIIRQAIQTLPSRDAEILLLKYTQDWSYRQLSEHLGISTSAVEARLHRARKKMRQTLSQLSPELIAP